MERNERETVDFMNVESFSQLPFIRPAAREKGSAIRLFGKEFGGGNYDDDKHGGGEGEGSKELVSSENYYMMSSSSSSSSSSTETSSRKFECHYCCRNFPTSQALGGHQNAHRRERQNAKRAHLQSVMVHGGHAHGLMSYSRLGSAPAVALPTPYHSWNGGGGAAIRSYNGNHQPQPAAAVPVPPPINGSPLGLWRIPAAQTPSSMPFPHIHRQIPLLNEQLKPLISTSQSRLAFESKPAAMQDHVSLDLRL